MSKAQPDINDTLNAEGPDAARVRHDKAWAKKANGKSHYKIADIHELFRKYFGDEYDMQTADAVLAVAATNKLTGDPPWLMMISGSGNAKTETVNSVSGVEHTVAISTIASEGALLSAVKKKNRSSTGGLLRQIGGAGILVIKDFTSIVSGDRKARAQILAALREIHDGKWDRSVGASGGLTISWVGRIICIAACTTAWDSAYSVLAVMGPRFVIIRSSARVGRTAAGKRSVRNAGAENMIRKEISQAVAALITDARLHPRDAHLTEDEEDKLIAAADIVTRARTGVEVDYQGNVIDAHEPEMPTRFSKQLVLIFRGALSIGIGRGTAMTLALRCARDSIPPIRLSVLKDLAANDIENCRVSAIADRLRKPWRTIRRTLEALYVLGLIHCVEEDAEEEEDDGNGAKTDRKLFRYSLAADVNLNALGRA
jgi:DNA-binding transcriptional ArsR family regulator